MKITLPNDVARCMNTTCRERLTCKRYLAFLEGERWQNVSDFKLNELGKCASKIEVELKYEL